MTHTIIKNFARNTPTYMKTLVPNVGIGAVISRRGYKVTNSFVISCKWCFESIQMRETSSGRYLPYEYNGVLHKCKGRYGK